MRVDRDLTNLPVGDVFHARGYVVRQEDRARNNPAHYLRRIRDIEQATGLDFFPELPSARADAIEAALPTDPWTDAGGGGGPGGAAAAQAVVRIHSLLPNPAGDENVNEAVTVRNGGSAQARLDGWRLRDAGGRTWDLFGTIDPGDERTFLRNGQAMALNNTGPETVELLDPSGAVVDAVQYDGAPEGRALMADDLR